MSHRMIFALAAAGLASASLAGCTDSSGNGPVIVPPPPPVSAPPPPPTGPSSAGDASRDLGSGFALAFAADPTELPLDPSQGDIVAIDLTADPIDIADPS